MSKSTTNSGLDSDTPTMEAKAKGRKPKTSFGNSSTRADQSYAEYVRKRNNEQKRNSEPSGATQPSILRFPKQISYN